MPGPADGSDTPMSPETPRNTTSREARLYQEAYGNMSAATNILNDAVKNHLATVDENGTIHFTDNVYGQHAGQDAENAYNSYQALYSAELQELHDICHEKHEWKRDAAALQ